MSQIGDLIKGISKTSDRIYDTLAIVRNIDKAKTDWIIDVEPTLAPNFDANKPNENNFVYSVQIAANRIGKNKYYNIPKVGSYVIIAWLNSSTAYVSLYSEITELVNTTQNVQYNNDNYSFTFSESGVIFNDGKLGGMVKVNELVDKINTLENTVNNLVQAISSITVVLAPAGTFPLAPYVASINRIVNTKVSDLENPDVTQ